MVLASLIVVGVLLVGGLVLAMVKRSDAEQAVGVLSKGHDREAFTAEPVVTGRQVERQAAQERGRSASTAVMVRADTLPTTPNPPRIDQEAIGVTRRQFLNRAILGVFGLSLAGFGASVLGFLWPVLEAGGFGSNINLGSVAAIDATIATAQPFYSPDARAYINPYPAIDMKNARSSGAYSDALLDGMALGYVGLYQKCPHLGCRVPWCQSSQWFECPCHGSQYNRVGEKKGGPAPRGMDRFALSISGGQMNINTSTVYEGPPIGTNTTGQEAEGPHCV
jgi:cytochrome b6-f complex iron-sulfur subunit